MKNTPEMLKEIATHARNQGNTLRDHHLIRVEKLRKMLTEAEREQVMAARQVEREYIEGSGLVVAKSLQDDYKTLIERGNTSIVSPEEYKRIIDLAKELKKVEASGNLRDSLADNSREKVELYEEGRLFQENGFNKYPITSFISCESQRNGENHDRIHLLLPTRGNSSQDPLAHSLESRILEIITSGSIITGTSHLSRKYNLLGGREDRLEFSAQDPSVVGPGYTLMTIETEDVPALFELLKKKINSPRTKPEGFEEYGLTHQLTGLDLRVLHYLGREFIWPNEIKNISLRKFRNNQDYTPSVGIRRLQSYGENLTAPEMAEVLNISHTRAAHLLKEGSVKPSKKRGPRNAYIIPSSSVKDFLENGRYRYQSKMWLPNK